MVSLTISYSVPFHSQLNSISTHYPAQSSNYSSTVIGRAAFISSLCLRLRHACLSSLLALACSLDRMHERYDSTRDHCGPIHELLLDLLPCCLKTALGSWNCCNVTSASPSSSSLSCLKIPFSLLQRPTNPHDRVYSSKQIGIGTENLGYL